MKNKTIITIFALILLAVFLRSVNLKRGFFGDEAVTLASVSDGFCDIIPNLVKYDAHPPLTSILLYSWMRIDRKSVV